MNTPRLRVLVLCTGNSARSQMAEALFRQLSHGTIDVESAGSHPQPGIHPMARDAMQRLFQLDLRDQVPKRVDKFIGQHFDFVFTVCDRAAESCPVFPDDPERIHWSFEDPAAVAGPDEERQRAFDITAKQLQSRIRLWMSLPEVRRRAGLD